MPSVNIYLKNSAVGTLSDELGRFKFPQKLNEGDTLIFSFIGYETQEYIVPKKLLDEIVISMSAYTQMMGAISVNNLYKSKPSGLHRLWSKFKRLF